MSKGNREVIVGVPREIKPGEQRVALTPAGVHELAARGHRVLVERGAGVGSGIRDDELVLKVKEPLPRSSSPTSTSRPSRS